MRTLIAIALLLCVIPVYAQKQYDACKKNNPKLSCEYLKHKPVTVGRPHVKPRALMAGQAYHAGDVLHIVVNGVAVRDRILASIQDDSGLNLVTQRCEVYSDGSNRIIDIKIPNLTPGFYHYYVHLGEDKDKDYRFQLVER